MEPQRYRCFAAQLCFSLRVLANQSTICAQNNDPDRAQPSLSDSEVEKLVRFFQLLTSGIGRTGKAEPSFEINSACERVAQCVRNVRGKVVD